MTENLENPDAVGVCQVINTSLIDGKKRSVALLTAGSE
jgi:hypothetical protein